MMLFGYSTRQALDIFRRKSGPSNYEHLYCH